MLSSKNTMQIVNPIKDLKLKNIVKDMNEHNLYKKYYKKITKQFHIIHKIS